MRHSFTVGFGGVPGPTAPGIEVKLAQIDFQLFTARRIFPTQDACHRAPSISGS